MDLTAFIVTIDWLTKLFRDVLDRLLKYVGKDWGTTTTKPDENVPVDQVVE